MSSSRVKATVVVAATALSVLPVAAGFASDRAPGAGSTGFSATAATVSQVQPVVALLPRVEPLIVMTQKRRKPEKGRGDRFLEVSATGSNDVPEAAMRAYRNAAQS